MQIAEYAIAHFSFGNSKKLVLWFQGCNKHCKGCISPEWRVLGAGYKKDPEDIIAVISKSNIKEIIISGGEPLLQYEELTLLLKSLKNDNCHIILYTGYRLSEVNKYFQGIFQHIDVLIAGPYIESLNNGKGLRGSTNQKIVMVTDYFKAQLEDFKNGVRSLELKIDPHYVMHIGIPPIDTGDL
ncbi:MAG TPA: 4Fe-4S single cluster domain-containing protein [Candidatus Cloacimonadota bacterium]|nr:4Fe-4S single cluster domain-containing protein [Candidatus Cloacimonadota bacterium]